MTREEAIKQLQQIIDVAHRFERNEKEIDAFDEEAILLAIKALESMPEVTVFRSGQIDTRTVEQATAEIKKLLEEGYFDKASFSIKSPSKRSEQTGEEIADFVEALFYTGEELLNGEREGISASEMMAMGDALAEGFREGLNGGADDRENQTSETMSLDEAINHAEEVAEEQEKDAKEWHENQVRKCETIPFAEMDYTHENECNKCAAEHRQLAEWLKDYKRLKEQEPCDKCVYSTKDGYCQYDDITETIPPFEPQESEEV